MRFPMPNFPCDFELPDDWVAEAGMVGFVATAAAYHSTSARGPGSTGVHRAAI